MPDPLKRRSMYGCMRRLDLTLSERGWLVEERFPVLRLLGNQLIRQSPMRCPVGRSSLSLSFQPRWWEEPPDSCALQPDPGPAVPLQVSALTFVLFY